MSTVGQDTKSRVLVFGLIAAVAIGGAAAWIVFSASSRTSSELPREVEALRDALPPTAILEVHRDLDLWGDVLVVNDVSRDRMAADLFGETLTAFNHWALDPAHVALLRSLELDNVFLCHTAIAEADDGTRRSSIQVVPLRGQPSGPSVVSDQDANGLRKTTVSCDA